MNTTNAYDNFSAEANVPLEFTPPNSPVLPHISNYMTPYIHVSKLYLDIAVLAKDVDSVYSRSNFQRVLDNVLRRVDEDRKFVYDHVAIMKSFVNKIDALEVRIGEKLCCGKTSMKDCFKIFLSVSRSNIALPPGFDPDMVMHIVRDAFHQMQNFIYYNPYSTFEEFMFSMRDHPVKLIYFFVESDLCWAYSYVRPLIYQYMATRAIVNSRLLRRLTKNENLVGIEENPGPVNSTLYRRVHASTLKVHTTKTDYRVDQENKRRRQVRINNARALKYQVEGLFDIGIDSKTTDSIVSMLPMVIDKLKEALSDLKVSHEISFNAASIFTPFMEMISSTGTAVMNFLIGVVKMILFLIDEKYQLMFDMMFPQGDIYHDASESFSAEAGLSWDLFFSSLYSKHFSSMISNPNWDMFIFSLNEIKKETAASKGAMGLLTSVANELLQLVCDAFDVQNPFNRDDPIVIDIRSRCNQYYTEFRSGQINEYSFAEKVFMLQDEIESALYSKRKNLEPQTKEALTYLLRKFQPLVTYCERNVNPQNGPRIEPLAILLAGPTGVGKSTITVPFLLSLMSQIINPEKKDEFLKNHNDFLFFRANENEFWDGYKMRNVAIVYDDFGQQRDSVGKPNPDAWELIRLKNTAPYHLHFASIEDKQRNFAQPKLIFATSNLQRLYFESLNCSEAVVRRFDLAYVQVPKVEFSIGHVTNPWERRLDIEKIRLLKPYNPDDPMTYADLDAIEFIPWDFITGRRAQGEVLTFNQLLKLAIAKHQHLSSRGDVMLKFHHMMKTFQPEMGEDPKSVLLGVAESLMDKARVTGKYVSEKAKKINPKSASSIVSLLIVGISVLTSFGLFNSFGRVGSSVESDSSKTVAKKGHTRLAKKSKTNVATSSRKMKIMKPEGGNINLDVYVSLLKRNMYRIKVKDSELGWATFLCGSVFVIPRHFEAFIDRSFLEDEARLIEFVCPFSGKVKFVLDYDSDLDLYDEQEGEEDRPDYIFLRVTEFKVRNHTNVIKFFPTERMLNKADVVMSQLACLRGSNIVFQYPAVTFGNSVSYVWDDQKFSSHMITYTTSSQKGDCGSLLVSSDSRFSTPVILGFHTAGAVSGFSGNKCCAGVFITREEVTRVLEAFAQDTFEEKFEIDYELESNIPGFNALGKLPQPRIPSKSKLLQSEMAGHLWEVTTKPAHLSAFLGSDGSRVEPHTIARANYSHDEVYVSSTILNVIFPKVASLVLHKIAPPPWAPRMFSFEEAIKGVNGVEFCEGVNRSTSPGYPYVLDNKGKGKTAWFGTGEQVSLTSVAAHELRVKVEDMIEDMEKGIRRQHVYVDYLKDERRKIAKVDQGKTRQFMACGLDLLVLYKMYFGDFIRHVCQNRIQNGICVGINPFSEWDSLVGYLSNDNLNEFTAGDYSKFDAKIPVPIGLQVLRVIEHFYVSATPEENKVREVLFHEIVNSLHVSQGKMYEFNGGNPSGNPLTSIFNSISNLLMLSYAGYTTCVSSNHDEFDNVFNRARFATFGDDNIIGYPSVDACVWEQSVLEKAIPNVLGMDYTNENKDGNLVSRRKITEVSFLKRHFKKVEGVWVCPLDLDVLRETLSWKREGASISEMKIRIECVLSEIARHGRLVFKDLAPRIIKASVSCYDYVPSNSTFEAACMSTDMLSF